MDSSANCNIEAWLLEKCRKWSHWIFETKRTKMNMTSKLTNRRFFYTDDDGLLTFLLSRKDNYDVIVLVLVPCHTCDFIARLCRATLTRDKVAACDFIVACCDFDAASSESLEAMFVCRTLRQSRSVRQWSRTLRLCLTSESRDKIARQNRRCDMALTVVVNLWEGKSSAAILIRY